MEHCYCLLADADAAAAAVPFLVGMGPLAVVVRCQAQRLQPRPAAHCYCCWKAASNQHCLKLLLLLRLLLVMNHLQPHYCCPGPGWQVLHLLHQSLLLL
jgi:hypothetical protein